MNKYNLIERFKLLNEDELRKIVYVDFQEYEPHAVIAAKEELFNRESGYTWESNDICLKDLIQVSDLNTVLEKLTILFPNEKINKRQYIDVLTYLRKCDSSVTDNMKIMINESKEDRINSWSAYGVEIGSGEKISLDFYPWGNWLSLRVENKQLQQLGIEVYIAYCMKAMTRMGFNENEIEEKYRLSLFDENSESMSKEVDDSATYDTSNVFIIDGISKLKEIKKVSYDSENEAMVKSHPWIRYFARTMDYFIWNNIIYYILIVSVPNTYFRMRTFAFGIILNVLLYYLWTFTEAFLISKTATTLGKWILNIKVTANNRKLNFRESYKRAFKVWLFGYGAGIQFLLIITNLFSYQRVIKNDRSKWDEEGNFEVSYGEISKLRIVIAIIFLLILPVVLYKLRFENIIL